MSYRDDGFVLHPAALVDADLLERVTVHMDMVIRGEFETGEQPLGRWEPVGGEPDRFIKIDMAHRCDDTIRELISHPAFGAFAAGHTGARQVKVWATQLLYKPPGGRDIGNLGWHQDDTYWNDWWDGDVFTVWVPLVDVTEDMGPVQFVRGSHTWGYVEGGNAFDQDMEAGMRRMMPEGAAWETVPGVLNAGGASLHHRRTIHGSGPNTSGRPRRSFALHMAAENARPRPGFVQVFADALDDPRLCPVVYDEATASRG